jgi:hypothetical protein
MRQYTACAAPPPRCVSPRYCPRWADLSALGDARNRILRLLADAPDGAPLGRFLPDLSGERPIVIPAELRRRAAWTSTFLASPAREGEVDLAQDALFTPIHVCKVPSTGPRVSRRQPLLETMICRISLRLHQPDRPSSNRNLAKVGVVDSNPFARSNETVTANAHCCCGFPTLQAIENPTSFTAERRLVSVPVAQKRRWCLGGDRRLPATPGEIAGTLSFALRYDGRRRVHQG